ncbi:Pol, partial [Symbiodinium necroappetens]
EILLPHLATLCQRLWRSPHQFHQLWADAWIAWLAKPGTAPDQPENLRPISLTEGGGRIVVKALTLHLRPSLTEATWSWPQYAYVPGRSIEHAIVRALHHCSRVQAAIASQRITLQERRTTGRTPTTCQGGVTLSIDTSKAFDTVDRGVLEQELKTARIPEPELTLIMSLHQNIGYWPAGPGSDIRVSSERGVRQGCPLAPSLWTLVTVALLRAMAGTDALDWIQNDTTMFADDLLLQWEYTSTQELERMISAIQECFRVLERLGLQVQRRKTQLLVAHKGRVAHRWWQMHTASSSEGRFLRIPQPNQKDLRLPVVTQLTYLGIVLSYKDAATATVEHRLQVAEAQRARLLKVLHSRTLPLRKRVQLWVACVRSSALYGLHLLDLQQKHVARITIVLVRHLRAISRSFAHMSQESSQALLLRLGVEDPLPFLLRSGQKLLTKTLQSQDLWCIGAPPPNVESTSDATVIAGEVTESLRVASLPGPLVGTRCSSLNQLFTKRHVSVVWYRQTLHQNASQSRRLPSAQLRPAMEHVPTQMDLDEEERQCFGNLLRKRALALGVESPSKYPHPGGKGAPPQGGGRPRQFQPNRGPRQTAPSQGSRSKEENRARSGTSSDVLLHKVAKALIVQSDYLSRLQSDHTVIFTFRNGDGPQLMVPLLHEVAENWRDQRSKGKVTKSLKQTLLQYVTAEIITSVTTFASDKSAQAKAQEMGWVTSDLEYNYLDWSAEEQRLVPRQEGTLTQDQILADARRLKTLLKQQELIIKFSVMSIFRKWFASSALLLLSLRLKPARPERSPVIKEIQEAVGWCVSTPREEQLIANMPAWRSLLEEWQHMHRQQDCMEFLHHLLERNPLPFATCRWEARPVPGTAAARRPLICGTAYVDVPLPRRAHATIQECVVQWHEQKIPHGLVVAPPILFVSLARYASMKHLGSQKGCPLLGVVWGLLFLWCLFLLRGCRKALHAMACDMAMLLCAPHGSNKVPRNADMADALHKFVLDTALEQLLHKWREVLQLPQIARLSLFTTYARAWKPCSAFCIWSEAWEILPGPQRLQMYKDVSLVFPDFAYDMLHVVYAVSCRGAYRMQQGDPVDRCRWQVNSNVGGSAYGCSFVVWSGKHSTKHGACGAVSSERQMESKYYNRVFGRRGRPTSNPVFHPKGPPPPPGASLSLETGIDDPEEAGSMLESPTSDPPPREEDGESEPQPAEDPVVEPDTGRVADEMAAGCWIDDDFMPELTSGSGDNSSEDSFMACLDYGFEGGTKD